jgi:hypothetical protein
VKSYPHKLGFTLNVIMAKTGTQAIPLDVEILQKGRSIVTLWVDRVERRIRAVLKR